LKYLKNLIAHLDRDSQSKEYTTPIEVDFARFIVENLLYLDYGVIEEVFTVIHTIDRILSSTGITLRESIENRDSSESIAILAQRSIVFSLMIGLKEHLKMAYNLTEAKCRAFDPKKTGSAKDNKTAVRSHAVGIVDWPDIPYLERPFENSSQMIEQLDAVQSPAFLTDDSLLL
jgi:cohesin loading factor subunit SCC2